MGGVALIAGARAVLAHPSPAALRSATGFAVVAKSAINSGKSDIIGNVASSPGSATGFASPAIRIGSLFENDATARQALADTASAYADLASRPCTTPLVLDGSKLRSGVYCTSAVQLSGTLILDGEGDANAVWILQVNGALTTDAQSTVLLINGANAANVFWQITGAVTLGAGSRFAGSVLGASGITIGEGATLSGRAMTPNGVVTLNNSGIDFCCPVIAITPETAPPATVGVSYQIALHASGGLDGYRYVAAGSLPPGLSPPDAAGVISGTPIKPGNYKFTIDAIDKNSCSSARFYEVAVDCPAARTLLPSPIPPAQACNDYLQTFSPSCGTSPYACTIDKVPSGMQFADCTLRGKPDTSGSFQFTVTTKDGAGRVTTAPYTLVVDKPSSVTISPTVLETGKVCTKYEQTLTVSCDPGHFLFSTSSPLPNGLTFNQQGVLSGTPTQSWNAAFDVTATDGSSPAMSHYILTIAPINFTPLTLPVGKVGVVYPDTTIAAEGAKTYTVSKGSLPVKLDLSTGGVISGTPLPGSEGPHQFVVSAKNAENCEVMQPYEIRICPVINLLPLALPSAIAGVFYTQTITPSGGSAPYKFEISGALPAGLNFDTTTGIISGTPLGPGFQTAMINQPCVTIKVTDNDGCTGERCYTIIVSCPPIALSPSVLPPGTAGSPYSQTLTASGGVSPYTFTITSGSLPAGLTLTSSGTIAGTPLATGVYCFTVDVSDAGCSNSAAELSLIVNPPSCPGATITLSPASFPPAAPGQFYSQAVTAGGGTAPYTYAVTSGSLPPGLALNSATGVVSGIPTAQGVFNFTLTATDANGCIGTMGCSVQMTVNIDALSKWLVALLAIVMAIVGCIAIAGRA